MTEAEKLLYETRRLMTIRYSRFASELARATISYRSDLKCHTAATDGKDIFVDPDFFASLSESDRLFLIAHELLHIKFLHAYRLEDKNGKKRDQLAWNIATDAIINANLKRDGFKIKEGYVDRPDATDYSAEELYEIILKERVEKEAEKQKNQNGQGNQDQQENGESLSSSGGKGQDNKQSENTNDDDIPEMDDHSLWEEAFENRKNKNKSKEGDDQETEDEIPEINEKEEFEENRKERLRRATENIDRLRDEVLNTPSSSEKTKIGSVGRSEEEIDWTQLLRREIERDESIWTQRRSIAENNYAYRLEDYDVEDEAETEVLIDVSGSVQIDMVRAFLRMVKPIIRNSKLRVGCFNERFWGMTEIHSEADIDEFEIPIEARGHAAWTEDWDLAVRSFTKKREINKIIFTDGQPCPGVMPKSDLRNENVIWLVYGNKDFNPCCGKVIQITRKQLRRLTDCIEEKEEEVIKRKL